MEPLNMFDTQGNEFRRYWRLLRKRLWLIIAFGLVGFTISLIQVVQTLPIYRGTVNLLIERGTPKLALFEDIIRSNSTGDYYQTQYRILQSRSLARQVIQTLHLGSHPDFAPQQPTSTLVQSLGARAGAWLEALMAQTRHLMATAATTTPAVPLVAPAPAPAPGYDPEAELVSLFLDRLQVTPVPNTHLVNLSFTSHDPRLAVEVVDTLAHHYIDLNLETRFATVQDALDWLNKRVSETRQKVESAELALQRYKAEHDVFSIDDRLPGVMEELSALNNSLIKARTERIGLETFYRQLQGNSGRAEMMEWMPEVVDNPLVQSLKSTLVDLQKTHAELSKKYGLKHPSIVRVQSQIDTVESKINAEVEKIVQATRAKYEVARARENTLLANVEKLKNEAKELNEKAIRYGVLKREAESNRRLYDLLLTRLKETSLNTELKSGDNIRIIDPAETPREPINVHPTRSLTRGTLFGLMLGIGLILFVNYLDNTLKSPEEAEAYLGLPTLGVIGRFKQPRLNRRDARPELVTVLQPRSQPAEAFKTLRANLLMSHTDTPRKVFLVTSPHHKDGKTTIAANLAVVLAQMERRVLLVDADLRNPAMHTIFERGMPPGLSDLLLTEAYSEGLAAYDERLTVVIAGSHPPNPSELLSSHRMQRFINYARTDYDAVVIDSPPLLAFSDALVLSTLVDGVVLVLRAGAIAREHARRVVTMLNTVQGEQSATPAEPPGREPSWGLRLVMNLLDPRESSAYSYYSHYSRYYHNDELRVRSQESGVRNQESKANS
jgi:succinoglycan biosynthesis transport protein ExoP